MKQDFSKKWVPGGLFHQSSVEFVGKVGREGRLKSHLIKVQGKSTKAVVQFDDGDEIGEADVDHSQAFPSLAAVSLGEQLKIFLEKVLQLTPVLLSNVMTSRFEENPSLSYVAGISLDLSAHR